MSPFGNNSDVYECETKDLFVTESSIVTRVFGDHMEDKNNLDVERLHIKDQTCHYMPRGFETFFPNLRGIRIASTHLQSIGSTDLKPFPRLIAVDFPFNDIMNIDSDTFDFNPKLNFIHFGMNKISFVGRNIFKNQNAEELQVYFYGNICVDQDAFDSQAIANLQGVFKNDCEIYSGCDC